MSKRAQRSKKRRKKKPHDAIRTTHLPRSACSACGYRIDAASAPAYRNTSPSSGDVSICLQCGHIMAFAEDLRLRDLTDAEMIEVAGDKALIEMQRARAHAAEMEAMLRLGIEDAEKHGAGLVKITKTGAEHVPIGKWRRP
jgi:hypothetical protein